MGSADSLPYAQRSLQNCSPLGIVQNVASHSTVVETSSGPVVAFPTLAPLASGNAIGVLADLSYEACGKGRGHQLAPRDWLPLQKERGRLIAWAARTGCKHAWRRFVPLLPHEKPVPTEIDSRVVVGLAGLQAAYDDGDLDFRAMSKEDARRATHYAVNEMNGFPAWFGDLANLQPEAVGEILSDCVRGEWQFPADRQNVHEVLSDLTWRGPGLTPLVSDTLLHQLQTGDPPNVSILEFALNGLAMHRHDAFAELAPSAASRTRTLEPDDPKYLLWLSVWIQLDAAAALDFLEEPARAHTLDRTVEHLCAILGGRRIGHQPLVQGPDYLAPIHLHRLIPLIYRHVRPAEDLDHLGKGAYTPTARDEAQDFRNALWDRLAQSDGAEVEGVLCELADEPVFSSQRDWILHLIDKHAEQHADLLPWTATDIRSFAAEFETEPKTDRELFQIVCRRLTDIKHDVERSDNSLRDELHAEDDERHLRRWFDRKLRESSRQRYTVPQEEEIDQQQKPDLRAENPRTPPISIEVKWANRWSLSQLCERLENQLVGQYLRAHNARYGVYLIGTIGSQEHWEKPTDHRRVDFSGMIGFLQERANEIVSSRPDIEEITVVGIDFRDPRKQSQS